MNLEHPDYRCVPIELDEETLTTLACLRFLESAERVGASLDSDVEEVPETECYCPTCSEHVDGVAHHLDRYDGLVIAPASASALATSVFAPR